MSITGVKSYSTANLQGQNSSSNTADLTARLTLDEVTITSLQQVTSGISYSNAAAIDLTTIDNNVTITKRLKCSYATAANDDVVNKLYCDNKVADLVNSAPASLDTLNELAAAMGNDANFSTTVINALAAKASLTGTNNMSNASNVFYGDGSNLNFNTITMTGANGLITTTGNNSITLATPALSTGGLFFQTQGLNRLWIAGGGASRFYQWIGLFATDPNMRQIYNTFYNLHDTDAATASGIYRGRLYTDSANCILELNAGHSFNTIIDGTNVFKVNSTALTSYVPIKIGNTTIQDITGQTQIINTTASSAISFYCNNATTQTNPFQITSTAVTTSGNIVLTNSAALIYATTANAYLAVGTPTGGGNLYLNSGGVGGIIISNTTGISNILQTTFSSPPICSTLPTIGTHLTNKNYVDSIASDPIGTIVMYSSNTIPSGWLLCDGQFVSTITYASLFAVIGYTYNNGVTPAAGTFLLPNFTGVYTRGKGTRAGLNTSTTTLGQLQTSSAGSHSHTMGTMSTDTQITTTAVQVVQSVGGLIGLTVNKVDVSKPLVTTQSTTGTGTTTINSYDGFGAQNPSEIRPNNISMNYIIKFQGTLTAITAASFTQSANYLTISNNYATSGLMNFQMRDAGSFLQTPLQLTATAINATVPVVCPTAPTLGNHLVNKTYCDNLVSSGANFVTTNTNQTIAGVKTFSNDLITNADVFGRNDGNPFNTYTSFGTYNLYPIGYCFEILGALSTPVNGSNYAGISASINLTNGVWAISGYLVLNKGNGAYVAASSVSVVWDTVAGSRIYPSSSGMRVPLITTNTTAQLIIPLGTINVVVTVAGVIQTITRSITMTVGTSTTWQVSFTGVKIA